MTKCRHCREDLVKHPYHGYWIHAGKGNRACDVMAEPEDEE